MTNMATPDMNDAVSVTMTVERGLDVLRAFRAERAPLSNAELVRRTGLSKATVSRSSDPRTSRRRAPARIRISFSASRKRASATARGRSQDSSQEASRCGCGYPERRPSIRAN